MNAFGVALPLRISSSDGFVMIKTIKRLVKQNLKMLILTNPGERVMEPQFGVGMKRYLFENFSQTTNAEINAKIREQVSIYLPLVNIINIDFDSSGIDQNQLFVRIRYSLPDINVKDLLQITI
jgi:phage baseplate assembly protein W